MEEEEAASRLEYQPLILALRRLRGQTKSVNTYVKKTDGPFVRSPGECLLSEKSSSNHYTTTTTSRANTLQPAGGSIP